MNEPYSFAWTKLKDLLVLAVEQKFDATVLYAEIDLKLMNERELGNQIVGHSKTNFTILWALNWHLITKIAKRVLFTIQNGLKLLWKWVCEIDLFVE